MRLGQRLFHLWDCITLPLHCGIQRSLRLACADNINALAIELLVFELSTIYITISRWQWCIVLSLLLLLPGGVLLSFSFEVIYVLTQIIIECHSFYYAPSGLQRVGTSSKVRIRQIKAHNTLFLLFIFILWNVHLGFTLFHIRQGWSHVELIILISMTSWRGRWRIAGASWWILPLEDVWKHQILIPNGFDVSIVVGWDVAFLLVSQVSMLVQEPILLELLVVFAFTCSSI